jgi:hypothetical protein
VDFDRFVHSLGNRDYNQTIAAIEARIASLKRARAREPGRRECLRRAERLLAWLRTGVLPEALDETERDAYRHIAEILVARGEMSAQVLAYLLTC